MLIIADCDRLLVSVSFSRFFVEAKVKFMVVVLASAVTDF
jgi:hypothetical protein